MGNFEAECGKEAETYAVRAGQGFTSGTGRDGSTSTFDHVPVFVMAALAFDVLDILEEFVFLLQKNATATGTINKATFINKVCKPTEATALQISHQIIDSFQTEVQKVLNSEKNEEVRDSFKALFDADFKKIFDKFWSCYSYQSQQIYEALFKVLKCGRNTNEIDKKALDALFCVVLGNKILMKDRVKVVFDAFDHNGDGTFDKSELTPYVSNVFELSNAVAHATATSTATFFTNHGLPAFVHTVFLLLAEHKGEKFILPSANKGWFKGTPGDIKKPKEAGAVVVPGACAESATPVTEEKEVKSADEMDLERIWLFSPLAEEEPWKSCIQAKFGKGPDQVKAVRKQWEKDRGLDKSGGGSKLSNECVKEFVKALTANCE